MRTEKKVPPRIWLMMNVAIVGLLIFLPYYLFGGRLFLGGDDTRIFYAYPREVMQSLAIFSWNTISSLSSYTPNHHFFPFLFALSGLEMLIPSKTVLFYFTFSLPLILGFIYFQKFVLQIIKDEYYSALVAALLYVLSPVTIFSQLLYFLSPAWLIALFPIYAYYYVKFLRDGRTRDIIWIVFWAILFSFANLGVPWLGGLFLPFVPAIIFLLIRDRQAILPYLWRSFIFGISLAASQLFWVIPFVISLMYRGDLGLAARVTDAAATFAATVNGTATGNVIYPLLTFYHKQLISDLNLPFQGVFTSYYDYILPLSIVFIGVLFIGLTRYKQVFQKKQESVYLAFVIAFLAALYFFTVNIGILKDVFILFGHVPGFGIFRNFTDKFALGYIFIYASLLYLSLYIVKKVSRFYFISLFSMAFLVVLNAVPIKPIINSPLWTTKDVYRTLYLPQEYLSFVYDIRANISPAGNIFSLPQNIASYSIISEDNQKHIYAGVSPVKFFSGVNDLSGSGSYPPQIAEEIERAVMTRNYEELLIVLRKINVTHVMVTNNIPESVQKSYMYNSKYFVYQDQQLIEALTDGEVITSAEGNYILYRLKDAPTIITSPAEISFTRVSPIQYKVSVNNLSSVQPLVFAETFHPGWGLYPSEYTNNGGAATLFSELKYAFSRPLTTLSHQAFAPHGNVWLLDPKEIKNLNSKYYQGNSDGSVSADFTLYFRPQIYFYFGLIITVVSIITVFVYLSKRKP